MSATTMGDAMEPRTKAAALIAATMLALTACSAGATVSQKDLASAWKSTLAWDVSFDHGLSLNGDGTAIDSEVPQAQIDEWTADAKSAACDKFADVEDITGEDTIDYTRRGTVVDDVLRQVRFVWADAARSPELIAAQGDVYSKVNAAYPYPDGPADDAPNADWDAFFEATDAVKEQRDAQADRLLAELYPDLTDQAAAYRDAWAKILADTSSDAAMADVQKFLIAECGLEGTDADAVFTGKQLGAYYPEG